MNKVKDSKTGKTVLKEILTDEILSKHSLEKQVAMLKAERNTYLAILNVGDFLFNGVVKVGLMTQGISAIRMIMQSKEVSDD